MTYEKQFTISVIIPAYNEEKTILEILEKVSEQIIPNVKFEIIVVDDGSTDKTQDILLRSPHLYDKFLKNEKNGGKGLAVINALTQASGDYILFQDADLEYDPNDYDKLIKPVVLFDADIVIGSRLKGSQITRVSYFWHKIGNILISTYFNILYGTTFTDIYSCYVLYKKDLVDPTSLKKHGWDQQAEIICEIVANGSKFYEVPINYYGRSYDEGKKIRPYHIIPVFWTIIIKRISKTFNM
jgi:glycosyltransferase involved in cell wall biosynthesis